MTQIKFQMPGIWGSIISDELLWIQDQSQVATEINRDLARICNWWFDNQLLLNPDKTKLLFCDSKQMVAKIDKIQLWLLGKQLTPVKAARDLGVILDTSLINLQRPCDDYRRFLYVTTRTDKPHQTLL
ncbi:hypothetical protein ACROYT_G015295 [Oculina patagonica]